MGSIRGYFTNCGLAGLGVTLLGKCSTDVWDWSRLKLNSSPPPPIPLTPTMTSLVLLFLICLDPLKLDPSLSCFPQGLLISLQGLLNVFLPLCSHCPSSRLHHLSPELFSSLLILHRYLHSISHQTWLSKTQTWWHHFPDLKLFSGSLHLRANPHPTARHQGSSPSGSDLLFQPRLPPATRGVLCHHALNKKCIVLRCFVPWL